MKTLQINIASVRFIISTIGGLLLTGCLSQIGQPNLATRQAVCQPVSRSFVNETSGQLIDQSLLTGQPCAAPCWQGLTPGASDRESVLRILEDASFVDQTSVQVEVSKITDKTRITWKSAFLDWPHPMGTITLDEHLTVETIRVFLEYNITVQKVLDLMGEPDDYVVEPLGIEAPVCYIVHLMWPQDGLSIALPALPKRAKVSSDLYVNRVLYFVPATTTKDMQRANGAPESSLQYIHPWRGLDAIKVR